MGDLIGQMGLTANNSEVICMCERAIAVSRHEKRPRKGRDRWGCDEVVMGGLISSGEDAVSVQGLGMSADAKYLLLPHDTTTLSCHGLTRCAGHHGVTTLIIARGAMESAGVPSPISPNHCCTLEKQRNKNLQTPVVDQ